MGGYQAFSIHQLGMSKFLNFFLNISFDVKMGSSVHQIIVSQNIMIVDDSDDGIPIIFSILLPLIN